MMRNKQNIRFHIIGQLCLLVFFLPAAFTQPPVISSVLPAKGPAGSNITITGTNFSSTGLNTVYFGGMRGNVVAGSATSIIATVPYGATPEPLRVVADTLTAFAAGPFFTTFAAAPGEAITPNAFGKPVTAGAFVAHCQADLNHDGQLDIAGAISGNRIAIVKNNSNPDSFSFSTVLSFSSGYSAPITNMIAADVTGDGKPDLVAVCNNSTSAVVYKNTSTNGNFSFEAAVFLTMSDRPTSVAATDIDGNGKTDLLFGYANSGSAFSVFRNTGTNGNIAFAARVNVAFGTVPGGSGNVGADNKILVTDIDGDNKPDVISVSRFFPPFLIYRNTSTPGTISFAAKVSITSGRNTTIGNGYFDLETADMDGDQKPDLVYVSNDSDYVSVYRNNSTAGNIVFSGKINAGNIAYPSSLCIQDMDGDGQPDVVALSGSNTAVLKNNSTGNNPAFNSPVYYPVAEAIQTVHAADLDNDGKPDLLVSGTDVNNGNANNAFVLKNGVYSPFIQTVVPVTASAGTPVTITGQRFTGTSGVYFGGVQAASFAVLSDSVIVAIAGAGASGNITVTTTTGYGRYAGFTFSPPIPVILSFSPASGPVGTTVVITGKNFSPAVAANSVYFGAGKATITAATDTTLMVTVPAGTSSLPIHVLVKNSGLGAFSQLPFITTFESHITNFSNADFGDTVNYATFSNPIKIATADFDNDQRPDIAASIYFNTNRVSVFKNTSMYGGLSFAERKDFDTYSGSFGSSSGGVSRTITVDIDGDDKPDMASVSDTPDWLAVHRNTSNADSISFAPFVTFATGQDPTTLTAADLDNDGKPDIAVTNSSAGTISILKNISQPGAILFQPKKDLVCGSAPQQIVLEDLDGDGKKDMVVVNYNTGNLVIFKNNSTPGTILFEAGISTAAGTTPLHMDAADLDGDGRPDLLITNSTSKSLSVYRNISMPGNIAFAPKTDLSLPDFPRGITTADLDGDGKEDIIAGNNGYPASISLFKNNSTPGNIVLAARVDIAKTHTPADVSTTDVNGDGKPDIILSDNTVRKITVLRNIIGDPVTAPVCSANLTLQSNITGTTYQWQTDTGNGFSNLADNADYTGTQARTLQIRNVTPAWYGQRYRCISDSRFSAVFILKPENRWTGTVSTAWENPANWSCGILPDSNSDVIIPGGSVIVQSNPVVKSIKVSPGVSVRVNQGFVLTVLR